ncbi:unnamed protein product [Hapterophycus canaliculatus]
MGRRFKGELRDLVERIHSTEVQYILCIRPNMENDPVLFEDEYVTQQLLSASIVEAAQVRGCCGCCVSRLRDEVASNESTLLADFLLIRDRHDPDSKSKYEVGKTKIFIRCGLYR